MTGVRWTFVLSSLLVVLSVQARRADATMYCGRAYSELTVNPGRPYNAVGFLSNGCTAFLVDSDHIVAAAHCFVNTTTGAWQTGLRFYPNFHPDRVAADDHHVPRADVTRAVVGSRAGESVLGDRMDWGIARVENWRDTTGLDLKPLYISPSSPAPGTPLVNPAYTRHHFPYNDADAVTWDNMVWDTTQCGWVGPNHGMWAITLRDAPFYDGTHRDSVGCNQRWGAGMIHADCTLTRDDDDLIIHDCDTVGGSSGSPILYQSPNLGWAVIGVGHGGGSTNFHDLVPQCTPETPARRDNTGPSTARFRFAPRFASNVAVHRKNGNKNATALFAVDGDLDKVVVRSRKGANPNYTSDFGFWGSLGRPYARAQLTRIAACSADKASRPQVFVVVDEAKIYTRYFRADGVWNKWTNFGLPPSVSSVVDIDATADASGRCQLLMVAKDGSAYARPQVADNKWDHWSTVACGSFKRITGLNYNGVIWATMLDAAGQIWRTSFGPAGWVAPTKLGNAPGVAAWSDIDMTWDEAARGFMVAVPKGGGDKLWFLPMYGSQAWSWHYFDTHLWAPGAPAQGAPRIVSVTASRWMEDPPNKTSPVVFATDDAGNIYFIEYTRVGNPRWVLDWKSFYHERIAY